MFLRINGGDNIDVGKAATWQHATSGIDAGKKDDKWISSNINFVSLFGFCDDVERFDDFETILIHIVIG